MSSKSGAQQCQVRVSSTSVLQKCQTRVSYKRCQETVSSESMSILQKCQEGVSSKSVLQKCQVRVSRKSVPQKCQISVSSQNVLRCVKQGCPTNASRKCDKCGFCLLTYMSAFGFVGSMLFLSVIMVGFHFACVLARCHVTCHFNLRLRSIWWHTQPSLASPLLTAWNHVGTAP